MKSKQPSETFLTRYLKARDNSKITGPFPYDPKFNYNNLVTNLVIDPIRSYSMRIETQMNDMLENYRFYGGIQTAFDWKSGDVYGEIQYLPHRVDYSLRVDRKVYFLGSARYLRPKFGSPFPPEVFVTENRVRSSVAFNCSHKNFGEAILRLHEIC
ncbi:MAG: hypothetical protein WDO14_00365 [Bacteroidota bacterium]